MRAHRNKTAFVSMGLCHDHHFQMTNHRLLPCATSNQVKSNICKHKLNIITTLFSYSVGVCVRREGGGRLLEKTTWHFQQDVLLPWKQRHALQEIHIHQVISTGEIQWFKTGNIFFEPPPGIHCITSTSLQLCDELNKV